ncbi:MAG: flagellar biosynthesis regulator FlaF [Maricaulaceae bacterium]|jgi:flagellar protein FlaF
MSVQAYQTSLSRAENPRQTEYRLLGQVTQALIDAKQLDRYEFSKRAHALDWNRRVWSAFASDCGAEGNGLPDALRAGIISLSIFVSKHSSAVLRDGAEIEPLIDINKMIMQGLAQSAENAAATQTSAA